MNTTKDLISVIIPIYNRQDVIEEYLNSVFAQSYQNFEIVLVDDGSTDRTYDICKQLAAAEPRIKLFAADHGGVSAARNKALTNTNGEYVFFLDSDDVIHPFLFETLVNGMRDSGAAIGATDVVAVRERVWYKVAQMLAEADGLGEVTFLSADEVVNAMLGGSSPLGCIGGVMMRRDLIGDTQFRTDLHIGEDYYFIYENIIKGASGVFLKQKWYYVRNHAHNSSRDYSFKGFWTRFYRRKLVWESEAAFGRTNHVLIQKRDAFACFARCIERNKPYSEDAGKMRRVLKAHKQDIYPALIGKSKLLFYAYLYLPAATALFFALKHKRQRKLQKTKR